ncbi:glycosyl transferase family 39 [Stanieria cyanosphaera PCC 7437]|uniref:Glycosyl transferase family 39 n=1 Tax=Stanieria cyanosphaera (strain ATCC 29371 / PCC 7437) TaxID=111780 RepID=K9XMZ2_STAC7|nr:glycosyltransferase family 39 protein [Stanieria cyanosphaera]AFZ33970.1 glycosyl transferase family 39 [Stanieria cyanosphaera PCC 7437]
MNLTMKRKGTKNIVRWWQYFEQYPQLYWLISAIWLIFISWFAFLWHLGDVGLVDETEPLFAEAARQMDVTGNWITPYFNRETRFDKPPLVYWLMAIGYQLIGVNEWAVRLPSALTAIALVISVFFTLKYFGFSNILNNQSNQAKIKRQLWFSAWIASALTAFNVQTIIWARTGVSDMLLSGCMGTALLCFFWGYVTSEQKPQAFNYWYFAFYILISLAVLTKGPVGIVLPGLIILSFLVYVGNVWSVVKSMNLLEGGLIFLCITLPWYILVYLENGQIYLDSFFGYHNFQRFTDVVNGHDAPWYFYFLIVLGLFAPWSVYLPLSIFRIRFWQRNFWQQQPRNNQLGLFAFVWFVCIFAFFTISVTKLPSYVLPLIPAASILVALTWSNILTNKLPAQKKSGLLITIISNLILVTVMAIAFLTAPQFIGNDPAILNFKESLLSSGLNWRGGIIWGIAAVFIAICLSYRKWWYAIFSINLITFICLIIFVLIPASFFIDQNRQLPLREIAQTIIQEQQPQEELIMVGFKKPSLVFYTQRPVNFIKHPKKANNYLNQQQNEQNNSNSSLLVLRTKEMKEMNLQPQNYRQLNRQGVYRLIRIIQ